MENSIIELVKETPNDMELGRKIRSLINQSVQPADEFTKMINSINRQFQTIDYPTDECDVSDLGNEIGIGMSSWLSKPENYKMFLHGINHGIDLAKKSK